jgi:ribosome-binding factor A
MNNTRLVKVSRQIQKDLSEIFQRNSQTLYPGYMVSVTQVRVSPDLSIAKVFLSVFPSNRGQEVLDIANANNKTIRHDLAQRVRHQLRIVPHLIFYIDDSLDYIDNIDKLLKQ